MTRVVSVRLDDQAATALRMLKATGLSRSEAIRSALVASANRLGRRDSLTTEVTALEVDDTDRAEMLEVAELMASLRAPG